MNQIQVCECKQEISSFNPVLGRYEDFIVTGGTEILACHRRVRSGTGGALAAEDFNRLAAQFLQAVREAGKADAVYHSLHGQGPYQFETAIVKSRCTWPRIFERRDYP